MAINEKWNKVEKLFSFLITMGLHHELTITKIDMSKNNRVITYYV